MWTELLHPVGISNSSNDDEFFIASVLYQRIVNSIHYCEATRKFLKVDYLSNLSASDNIYINPIPLEDSDGNSLDFEFGLSEFVDIQKIILQDLPELSPVGQLPRSVECMLEGDLCGRIKPGDRVRIYGVYKVMSIQGQGNKRQSTAKLALIVNNIVQTSGTSTPNVDISLKEGVLITQISKIPNIFDILSKSIAPSIYGHDIIKKSLLLFLLGGVTKEFNQTNTRIRGNINMLLIGDPSTAKSQLLRFVLNIAPLAVSANARSSSGVGLTAAVVSDGTTGERMLQAGAMVLADGGVVCIDELDKMTDVERVHMHEVMEQQTFSVFKAGIAMTLNARCSVLAACNPVYGKYNRELPVTRNVHLPDSLLSRFDLVFIMTDDYDMTMDRDIARHVLTVHKFSENSSTQNLKDELDKILFSHGDSKDEISYTDTESLFQLAGKSQPNHLPLYILQKYIHYAKTRCSPVLNDKAREMISQKYVSLRSQHMNNRKTCTPITPRTLESLIRLSAALAKVHLRDEILEEDVEIVFQLFDHSLEYIENGTKRHLVTKETTRQASPKKQKSSSIPVNFDYVNYIKNNLTRKTSGGSITVEEFTNFLLSQNPKMVEESEIEVTLNQLNQQGFCILSPDLDGVPTIYRFS